MQKLYFLFLGLTILGLHSCRKSYPIQEKQNCAQTVLIDKTGYEKSLYTGPLTENIDSLYILGDCLHIQVSSLGCEPAYWTMTLYDAGELVFTFPASRLLNFTLEDRGVCPGPYAIQREFSYDISSLRADDEVLLLSFPQYSKAILYK